jgi:hypothetical protein
MWGRFVSPDKYLGMNNDHLSYNLYVYVSNNPVSNVDPTGQFLNKIVKAVKKVAKAVMNTVKTIAAKVANTTKKTIKAVKNSFVFEGGIGLGLGGTAQIGSAKIQIGAYKDFGIGISDAQKYDYTTTSAAIKAEIINKVKAGVGIEINHLNDNTYDLWRHDNPMVMPWEIWDCPNTSKDILLGLDYADLGNVEKSEDTFFLGLSLDFHFIIGGHIKLGFNIK